jgi:hypothetical protein
MELNTLDCQIILGIFHKTDDHKIDEITIPLSLFKHNAAFDKWFDLRAGKVRLSGSVVYSHSKVRLFTIM